jgi:hypothetical protein
VPVSQVLTLVGGTVSTVLSANQLLSPLILNDSATIGEVYLPDAFSLSNAFGNNSSTNALGATLPYFSPLPSSQVQVGDVFTVPVYQLSSSTTAGGTFFFPGTGGSGGHHINNYTTRGNRDAVAIQFTAVGGTLATCSYTLQ